VREGEHRVDRLRGRRIDRVKIVIPTISHAPGGLNIRTPDGVLDQEARLQDFKRDAMLAFVRANNLNRIVLSGGRQPKVGIITVGKSYLDVRQAMDELGLDEVKANDMGLRLYKVACPWPLSQRELLEFAQASTSSWWWRRSARSSRCRCARSSTAPPTSRSASARRTRAATGSSP
jgi:TPP-dependent indolepyruvate ferredoxin oxidoreductase alpha subunit